MPPLVPQVPAFVTFLRPATGDSPRSTPPYEPVRDAPAFKRLLEEKLEDYASGGGTGVGGGGGVRGLATSLYSLQQCIACCLAVNCCGPVLAICC